MPARKLVPVNAILPNSYAMPDAEGRFGPYGGRFVAETLMPLVLELNAGLRGCQGGSELPGRAGRLPDPLCRPAQPAVFRRAPDRAPRRRPNIWFKRDELNHTGAHKINNCMGQILLAMRMGKTRIIAETGAGQHGVATATVCARFGLQCVVYMGATDVERQSPNVFRMKLLGAEVVPVTSGRGDAEGRHERGDARLGHQRRGHLLPDRHGGGAAPLSGHGARLPVGDRQGDADPDAGAARTSCRTRWSRPSAADRTPSACSTPSSRTRACG